MQQRTLLVSQKGIQTTTWKRFTVIVAMLFTGLSFAVLASSQPAFASSGMQQTALPGGMPFQGYHDNTNTFPDSSYYPNNFYRPASFARQDRGFSSTLPCDLLSSNANPPNVRHGNAVCTPTTKRGNTPNSQDAHAQGTTPNGKNAVNGSNMLNGRNATKRSASRANRTINPPRQGKAKQLAHPTNQTTNPGGQNPVNRTANPMLNGVTH
jgi:hypothetical protein